MYKSLFLLVFIAALLLSYASISQSTKPGRFKVLALAENGGHHIRYTQAAKTWLNKLAADSSFTIDYIETSSPVNEKFLSQYQLFIQLDFPPYTWSSESMTAFIDYIENGKGGWIGFHHATLLGEFDGYPMWAWFSEFMGGIRWKNYIADFATATVKVEDSAHPIMKGISGEFIIDKEEWYTYDKSPRANVHVIASVDESTYSPDSKIKMGDHPVIWSNPKMSARNVYIFMGHSPDLFNNATYTALFKNAIFWAAKR